MANGKTFWDFMSEMWEGIVFLFAVTLFTPVGWVGMAILYAILKD